MKNNVLVIQDGSDMDIITSNGGYAFCWSADGKIKVDLHQDRIEVKLEEDGLNEFLQGSKCYYREYSDSTLFEDILKYTLAWLGFDEHVNVTFRLLGENESVEGIINKFLFK